VRPEDLDVALPCDGYVTGDVAVLLRAIDVAAPAELLYRWVCQIRVAPYSYDLIDNRGRKSPDQLTPGAEEVRAGDQFLVFTVVDVEAGVHISGLSTPAARRLYGPFAISYVVLPIDAEHSRLLVRMCCAARGPVQRLRRWLIEYGDLVMMRKQLLNLRALAERDAMVGTFRR
jgi:hypothetical protein